MQGPFEQQQQPLYPSDTERLNKSEDTLEKFMKATMASHKNNMTTSRNIDIQMEQTTKQVAERQSDKFSANTKEHCNNVVDEKEDETEGNTNEKEKEHKRSEEKKS